MRPNKIWKDQHLLQQLLIVPAELFRLIKHKHRPTLFTRNITDFNLSISKEFIMEYSAGASLIIFIF